MKATLCERYANMSGFCHPRGPYWTSGRPDSSGRDIAEHREGRWAPGPILAAARRSPAGDHTPACLCLKFAPPALPWSSPQSRVWDPLAPPCAEREPFPMKTRPAPSRTPPSFQTPGNIARLTLRLTPILRVLTRHSNLHPNAPCPRHGHLPAQAVHRDPDRAPSATRDGAELAQTSLCPLCWFKGPSLNRA